MQNKAIGKVLLPFLQKRGIFKVIRPGNYMKKLYLVIAVVFLAGICLSCDAEIAGDDYRFKFTPNADHTSYTVSAGTARSGAVVFTGCASMVKMAKLL